MLCVAVSYIVTQKSTNLVHEIELYHYHLRSFTILRKINKMPPKKERGKQRKAAKNLAAANGTTNISRTVALLRKGDNKATKLLGDGSLKESNGILYEQSGILSTVLKFLKRCEDDTFVKVMLDVGGNLKTPRVWIDVLIKAEAQEPSCQLQIAHNIGPLVRCMCNDTTRLFFKSNEHWVNTMQGFAALIHNMILKAVNYSDKSKGEEIIDTLLRYEGLLTTIIQWGFWEEDCRPDITNGLRTNHCVSIVSLGKATLNRLIKAANTQTEQGRKRLETIGSTPIISKDYDPECKVSFVAGLIRQVKIEGWTINTSYCLRRLISNVSCVDKDVITELIDLGINTKDDTWVVHVAVLLHYMILKYEYNDGSFYSNDTRVAFAIRGGLIKLCLTFIDRFGLKESFDKKKGNLSSPFFSIEMILANIYWIGLHKKTAKAIRNKRCSIEKELARLDQNIEITNNVNCKKLLGMTRSILDINGSYCCRCNKSLSRTEVKLCNGCGCMVYCSRACQKEDWLNGHSESCCKTYNNERSGLYQGRHWPKIMPENERAAAKFKELEVNMNMIQLKLFHDHSETILSQVSSLDIPLYDCVVYFDLREYPLVVKVKKWTEFYNNPILKRGFEGSRSKTNVTCIFFSYVFGNLVEGQIPKLQMQRLFPHEWLPKKKAGEIDSVDY